ncbi:hypothetical protein HR17_02740 [Porphyromonas gulae]|nr:hypothetical protein HR17_02740 [Porphyromonas gulae]KGO04383.1 hypothetical protein HR16_06160 [Porphyromonas gulae]
MIILHIRLPPVRQRLQHPYLHTLNCLPAQAAKIHGITFAHADTAELRQNLKSEIRFRPILFFRRKEKQFFLRKFSLLFWLINRFFEVPK